MIILFSCLTIAGPVCLVVGGIALQAYAAVSALMFAATAIGGMRSVKGLGSEAVRRLTRKNIQLTKKNAARDKSVSV